MTILYVGGEDHLCVTEWSSDGLSIRQKLSLGPCPSFLAFAPSRRRAYAVVEGGDTLASLQILENGHLECTNQVPCAGGPAYVSVDPTERWVFSASYGSGEVRVYRIEEDGDLAPAHQELTTGKWAHSALLAPSRAELYVPNKGSDRITRLAFDASSGRLRPLSELTTAEGAGPRHIVFTRSGELAYVTNENDCTLLVLERAEDGYRVAQTVSTLPRSPQDGDTCADVHLSPDERFLYVSNRGHDSIAVFSCTGRAVRLVAHEPTQGKVPRHFSLLGETRLVCANQESGSLALFSRDPTSGHLSHLETHELGERAFWVGPARPPGSS